MPISLENSSNIRVTYNTGSNYVIETVKSDIYVRGTTSGNLSSEPTVSPDIRSSDVVIETFTYTTGTTQTTYTKVFSQNTLCDILIVGGGGGGDGFVGGGGGGGAVLYATGVEIPAGSYAINVGKGGTPSVNGSSSQAFGATCLGGGSTVYNDWGTPTNGRSGGSGSGGSAGYYGYPGGIGGGVGISTKGTLLNSGTLYNGNIGGNGLIQGPLPQPVCSGGGGGAGSAGKDSISVQYTTRQQWINEGKPGSGGDGIPINITGTTYYWGAGGGGSSYATHSGDGGLGGGGGGGASYTIAGLAGTGGINNGNNGTANSDVGGNAGNGTGSGGGGGNTAGSGGSGIVIIKYRNEPKQIGNEKQITLTFDNENNESYYPIEPSTNSATWTDNGYTVRVKVSDTPYYNYVYQLFNHKITLQDHYHSQQIFTGTGNTYAGSTRFKTYAGIAISIDLGRSIYPTKMRIAPRPLQEGISEEEFRKGYPKIFKIFASDDASCWNDNNHSSWTLIHDQTSSLTYSNEQYTIVNFRTNLPEYRYYTMVVLSTVGSYVGGYLHFAEWNIAGRIYDNIIYRVELLKDTNVKINNTPLTLLTGNYNIVMGSSSSKIIKISDNTEIGSYNYIDDNKVIFKYEISRSLNEINKLDTNFPIISTSVINSIGYYFLDNKSINQIKKYKIFIYKINTTIHDIELYFNNNDILTKMNKGTDYISRSTEDSGTIILFNYYITINKHIKGNIYLKSDKIIFNINENIRGIFNNTSDSVFKENVNNFKKSGSSTLTQLNNMFGVKKASDDKAAATAQLIKLNDSTIPISISYNTSSIDRSSRNSLDTLVTTFNNVNSFDETTVAGQLQSITNTHNFRNVLSSTTTNIEEYISYELATEKTPQTPTITLFNIQKTAQKYIYFKKL